MDNCLVCNFLIVLTLLSVLIVKASLRAVYGVKPLKKKTAEKIKPFDQNDLLFLAKNDMANLYKSGKPNYLP